MGHQRWGQSIQRRAQWNQEDNQHQAGSGGDTTGRQKVERRTQGGGTEGDSRTVEEMGMIGEIQSGISHPVDQQRIEAEPGEYWDDVTGVPLKQELVEKARMEEMRAFPKHGVYTKVPEEECWNATGKGPCGVRWVDINKRDADRPEY